MTTIYAINKADPKHLDEVIAQMQVLGAPTVKAVWCGDCYRAVEGSHRLAAASKLGLTPILDVIKDTDEISHDCDELSNPCQASEMLEYAGNTEAYEFDEIELY